MSEFNHHADAFSAARVFALTSLLPQSTLPPSRLPPYPRGLSKQLKLTLFPLDITNRHCVTRGEFRRTITPLLEKGSPLAEWVNAFMATASAPSNRSMKGRMVTRRNWDFTTRCVRTTSSHRATRAGNAPTATPWISESMLPASGREE